MDEQETVKLFLEKGFQISREALPLILANPELMISKLEKTKPRPLIVTENHIKKILEEPKKPKIEMLREFTSLKKPIKIEDYVQHFTSRYEKFKQILSHHMSLEKLVSINKITPETTNFSIIGIAREKRGNSLLVEDSTGEIEVFFNDSMKQKLEEIFLDDIIGIRCKRTRERFYADTVIYPDIPLGREVKKTKKEVKIMIISDFSKLNEERRQKVLGLMESTTGLSSVFHFSNGEDLNVPSNLNIINISGNTPPNLLNIDNMKILTLPRYFFQENKIDLVSVLKRRYILPTFNMKMHVKENNFMLEEVPDIVISNLDDGFYKNYKGTTIISNSDPNKIYLVDFKTRKVVEEKL